MEHIRAKKSLGQHFLKDQTVLGKILEAAEVRPGDAVLEIGPGTGVLTEALAAASARVVAIELDHFLVERLQRHFVDSKQVSILEGNILDIHLAELLETFAFENGRYKIIANIPYYITAPIIRSLLMLERQPLSMTLLVQDEVAKRLAAPPGEMSLLSVMAQYYAAVEKKFFVPKEVFEPMPKVDSAVIRIDPKRSYDKENDRRLFRLVRAGFAARRKTLTNNLSGSLAMLRAEVETILETIGLRQDIRAQVLSVDQWVALEKAFSLRGTEKKEDASQ